MKKTLKRSLAALLSLLMVVSLFTVCNVSVLAEESSVTETVLKTWSVEDLEANAIATGSVNAQNLPIYHKADWVTGVTRSEASENWLFHSMQFVIGDKFTAADTLVTTLYYSGDLGTASSLGYVEWSYNNTVNYPVQLTADVMAASVSAPEKGEGVLAYTFEVAASQFAETIDSAVAFQLRGKSAAGATFNFYGAELYKKNADESLSVLYGTPVGKIRPQDGSCSFDNGAAQLSRPALVSYGSEKGDGQATVELAGADGVSYASLHTGVKGQDLPVVDKVSMGTLTPGQYALNLDFATLYGLGNFKFTLEIYAGTEKVLSQLVDQGFYFDQGWSPDSGLAHSLDFDFRVGANKAGREYSYSILFHDQTYLALFGASLKNFVTEGGNQEEIPDTNKDFLKTWSVEDLEANAMATGSVNAQNLPIYHKADWVTGVTRTEMSESWLFHSMQFVIGDKFTAADTLVTTLYYSGDLGTASSLGYVEWSYNNTVNYPVQLTADVMAASVPAPEKGEGVLAYTFEVAASQFAETIDSTVAFQLRGKSAAGATFDFYGAELYKKNADESLSVLYGTPVGKIRPQDGSCSFDNGAGQLSRPALVSYGSEKGDGQATVELTNADGVSYASLHTGVKGQTLPVVDKVSMGTLTPGQYALNLDFATLYGLGSLKFTLEIYAGSEKVLSQLVDQGFYFAQGWSPDSGLAHSLDFDFRVGANKAGREYSYSILFHDQTYLALFGAGLKKTETEGGNPGTNQDFLKTWSVEDLEANAMATGSVNEQNLPIYHKADWVTGVTRGANNQDQNWMFHSLDFVKGTRFESTDTLVAKVHFSGDLGAATSLGYVEISYENRDNYKIELTSDAIAQAVLNSEMGDGIYTYTTEFSAEFIGEKQGDDVVQFRGRNAAGATFNFYGAELYKKNADDSLSVIYGTQVGKIRPQDASCAFDNGAQQLSRPALVSYGSEKSDGQATVELTNADGVAYASLHTGVKGQSLPVVDKVPMGTLATGQYALNLDFATLYGLGNFKFTLEIYAGQNRIYSKRINQSDDYLAKNWTPDSGLAHSMDFTFGVGAENAGKEFSYSILFHNETYLALFGAGLKQKTAEDGSLVTWDYKDILDATEDSQVVNTADLAAKDEVVVGVEVNGGSGQALFANAEIQVKSVTLKKGQTLRVEQDIFAPNRTGGSLFVRIFSTSGTPLIDNGMGPDPYAAAETKIEELYGYAYRTVAKTYTLPDAFFGDSDQVTTDLNHWIFSNGSDYSQQPLRWYEYRVYDDTTNVLLYTISGETIANSKTGAGATKTPIKVDLNNVQYETGLIATGSGDMPHGKLLKFDYFVKARDAKAGDELEIGLWFDAPNGYADGEAKLGARYRLRKADMSEMDLAPEFFYGQTEIDNGTLSVATHETFGYQYVPVVKKITLTEEMAAILADENNNNGINTLIGSPSGRSTTFDDYPAVLYRYYVKNNTTGVVYLDKLGVDLALEGGAFTTNHIYASSASADEAQSATVLAKQDVVPKNLIAATNRAGNYSMKFDVTGKADAKYTLKVLSGDLVVAERDFTATGGRETVEVFFDASVLNTPYTFGFVTKGSEMEVRRVSFCYNGSSLLLQEEATEDLIAMIEEVGGISKTNHAWKLPYIEEAEDAVTAYQLAYGEAALSRITNLADLIAAREAHDIFKAEADQAAEARQTALSDTMDLIDSIGSVTQENYTKKLTSIEDAEMAVEAYEAAYGKRALADITNIDILTAARSAYDAFKAAEDNEKTDALDEVLYAIDSIGQVTVENYADKLIEIEAAEDAVEAYVAAYGDGALDDISNIDTLTAARKAYTDAAAAGSVMDAIEALPSVDRVTLEDAEAVAAARAAYTALTKTQKAMVSDEAWEKMVALEKAIKELAVTYGDVDGNGKVDAADALMALQHAVKLITLEGKNYTATDVNGDRKIDAADALLMLQYTVKLIDKFPVEA